MRVRSREKVCAVALMGVCVSLVSSVCLAGPPAIWPVPGCSKITSSYGPRGTTGYVHSGVDISCGKNEPVVASAAGKIVGKTLSKGQCKYDSNAGTCPSCDNSSGNSLTIDHGDGYKTAYLHLQKFMDGMEIGATVECGQQIGVMGTTGCSTGNHTHFMVYVNGSKTNPVNYVTYDKNTCVCVPKAEVCDGVDNDCDGVVDEEFVCEPSGETTYQSMNYDFQNTDVDGDGYADLCARASVGIVCAWGSAGNFSSFELVKELSNDNGWGDESNYATIRFADINGDGKADLCGRSDTTIDCWPSTGRGFGNAVKGPSMADADGYNQVKYFSTIRFADINGDKKDDVCARFKDGYKCYLSTGSGFDSSAISTGEMSDSQGWGEEKYYATVRVGDVNGDGKADVCARGMVGMRCWLSTGSAFSKDFTAVAWSNTNGWENGIYFKTIRMMDLNGDGKKDLCARDDQGLVCHLSNGSSFGNAIRGPQWSDSYGWNDYDNYSTIMFGDLNGDGKDDVCARANANLTCSLSTGSGFGASYDIADLSDSKGYNKPAQYRTIRMGDVNGDGRADVCARSNEGVRCYLFNGNGFDAASVGPEWSDANGWGSPQYYSTFRFGGPLGAPCNTREEICDGKDNNCNGQVDEGDVCKPVCTPANEVCDGVDNDCDGQIDEDDVCKPVCVPSDEICDGKDNDCDGEVDEGDVCNMCEPTVEVCDNIDNDCDGEIDEDGACTCVPSEEVCDHRDNDCDGETDEGNVCCTPEEEVCDSIDNDCDGVIDEDDVCDHCEPQEEVCDGKDNDCDGEIDEGDICYNDFGYEDQNYYGGQVLDGCECSLGQKSHAPSPVMALLALLGLAGAGFLRRRKR